MAAGGARGVPPVGSGVLLGGRYRLLHPLNEGGMAVVWTALDLVLERRVAVKMPRDQGPPGFDRRFQREARAAAKPAHPAIVSVYDYGEATLPGGRVPYVVVELLAGQSLARRLTGGPLPWTEAAGVFAELAEALAAAHAAGVVHRDIKPANVFLTPTGVKLLDFGIAFTVSARPEAGPLLGTPAYVPPELRAGAQATPAADVYALGVTLLESLTGQRFAEVPGDAAIPGEAARLCRRCLAERPEDRPAAAELAAQLATELARLARDGEDAAATRPAAPSEHQPPPKQPLGQPPPPEAPPPSGPPAEPTRTLKLPGAPQRPLVIGGVVAGVAAGGLVAVAAVVLALADSAPPPRPGAAAPPPAEPSCAVDYTVDGEWQDGFQARVRVTNLGAEHIDGWRLAWTFPDGQRITQVWNGRQRQRDGQAEVTGADWNRSIPPRGSVDFGFLGSRTGGNGVPQRFTLNGRTCRSG